MPGLEGTDEVVRVQSDGKKGEKLMVKLVQSRGTKYSTEKKEMKCDAYFLRMNIYRL